MGFGLLLLLLSLALPAWAARPGGSGLSYEAVSLPAGSMSLELPLNPYLNTDYLSVPVHIPDGLRLGRTEVTRALWQACHEAGACEKSALPALEAGPDHPMVGVNWHEARAFAQWWSKRTHQHWRLPTEHEWFYAASLGKGWRSQEKRYSYADQAELRDEPKRTFPVGHFGSNAWGIVDLEGNVWEWTLSCYTLAADKLLQPPVPAKLDDPDCCMTRVVGGEHRAEVPDFVADTYQGGCSALKPAANLGFRLVLEP
jgi:formylglycine-generating enzyme required for sulfatase activity